MFCSACSQTMNTEAKYCAGCGRAVDAEACAREQRRLTRPLQSRMIAGVCAGFAQYFGWDVTLVRLAVCLAVLFGAGTPVIAYFVAWAIMPESTFAVPMQPVATTEAQTGATAS